MTYRNYKIGKAVIDHIGNTVNLTDLEKNMFQYLSLHISVLRTVFSIDEDDCFRITAFLCGYYGLVKNKYLKAFEKTWDDIKQIAEAYYHSMGKEEPPISPDPAYWISQKFLEIASKEFDSIGLDDVYHKVNTFINHFTPVFKEIQRDIKTVDIEHIVK